MNDALTLAKQYLENHKNPVRKFELPGSKLIVPKGTEAESQVVERGLSNIKGALQHERVERRCARVTAYWCLSEKLAKLKKGGKILNTFGFANKDGMFLYPEEALVLLEMNRIELFLGKLPINIQQAYDILIATNTELHKYVAYKKLSFQGFRLSRSISVLKNHDPEENQPLKKVRLDDVPQEKINMEYHNLNEEVKEESPTDTHSEIIKNLFNKLQEQSPKQCLDISLEEQSDYRVFSPENTSRTGFDFHLRMSNSKNFDTSLGFSNSIIPTVVSFGGTEFLGYFQVARVNLPTLSL